MTLTPRPWLKPLNDKNKEGVGAASTPQPTSSIYQQTGKQEIDSILAVLIARIARHYPAQQAAIFDETTTGSIAAAAASTTTGNIFTVPSHFALAVITGVGILSPDPAAWGQCTFQWLIDNKPIPLFQTNNRIARLAPVYSFTNPISVYIEVPRNGTFQLQVINNNAVDNYKIIPRALGWYD